MFLVSLKRTPLFSRHLATVFFNCRGGSEMRNRQLVVHVVCVGCEAVSCLVGCCVQFVYSMAVKTCWWTNCFVADAAVCVSSARTRAKINRRASIGAVRSTDARMRSCAALLVYRERRWRHERLLPCARCQRGEVVGRAMQRRHFIDFPPPNCVLERASSASLCTVVAIYCVGRPDNYKWVRSWWWHKVLSITLLTWLRENIIRQTE